MEDDNRRTFEVTKDREGTYTFTQTTLMGSVLRLKGRTNAEIAKLAKSALELGYTEKPKYESGEQMPCVCTLWTHSILWDCEECGGSGYVLCP